MNRRTFLRTVASSTMFVASASPWVLAADARTPRSDDEWLAEARERILNTRRSGGVVAVRDAAGKPVSNVSVRIEQQRHEFLFGCNFFRFARIADSQREQQYREQFARVFNYATLGFYWRGYEPERGKPGYAYSEQTADWCREHHIACKGHPLVWDHPASSPGWLPEDTKELEQLSNARVRDIVTRFKGRIDIWDVVNEATHLPQHVNKTRMANWGAEIGNTRYTAEPLKIARAANPQAKLIVNDYRTDPPFLKLLETLRDDGRPLFDVVGIQSHMHGGGWPLARLWELCDTCGKFGLPVHFTETTVVSGPRRGRGEDWSPTNADGEAKQAGYVPKFYTMLFAHPAMEAITWWDFADDGAWQGAAAGWVRKDMSPKPAYERMHELIKQQWWTRAAGQTNADGEFKVTAFHGTQRVTVHDSAGKEVSREVTWQHGQANRIEIQM